MKSMFFLKKSSKQKMKKSSRGATLIEYTLIASLLVVMLIGMYKVIGNKYTEIYDGISNAVDEE